jgi:hypothetical protein
LKPIEIAPEKPQERFLLVSTGPFREEFHKRPIGGLFAKPVRARLPIHRRVRFPPRLETFSSTSVANSETPRLFVNKGGPSRASSWQGDD